MEPCKFLRQFQDDYDRKYKPDTSYINVHMNDLRATISFSYYVDLDIE